MIYIYKYAGSLDVFINHTSVFSIGLNNEKIRSKLAYDADYISQYGKLIATFELR